MMLSPIVRRLYIAVLYLWLPLMATDVLATVPGTITTYAGSTASGVLATNIGMTPFSVAIDAVGDIYVSDITYNVIRKVEHVTGMNTVVAGNGGQGYNGDGGAATNAELYLPASLAVDSGGNLYLADTYNNRIRKVDTSGNISTIAGNGTAGFSGDGGAAISAALNNPYGVAVDNAGNIYIADSSNNRIRKVDTGGNIQTVAGNGTQGPSGDGGAATLAALWHPTGVAVDTVGNLFIADQGNGRIRKVDTSGNISTVAGDSKSGYNGDGEGATSAALSAPTGVTIDGIGNVYVADSSNQRIRKIDTRGNIHTVAGNGTAGYVGDGQAASSAELSYPSGVTIDNAGNLYIADQNNNRIRKVDTDGSIHSLVGNGSLGYSGDGGAATSGGLDLPTGIAFDGAGNLYVADQLNQRIRKVDTRGTIHTVAGNGTAGYGGDGGAATSAALSSPQNVTVDSAGNLYIVDGDNNRIRKVDSGGNISTVAGNGTFGYSGDGGAATSAALAGPESVAIDSAGNLYIADQLNNRIRKVDARGNISTVAGNGTAGFSGDSGPAFSAALNLPSSVIVDSGGNLYIADFSNNRVRKVDTSGNIHTVAGNGAQGYSGDGGDATGAALNRPSCVTLDSAGNLYIADYDGNRIRKVDTNGNISTVAGNGTYGYGGDGGASTSAALAKPSGIAFDSAGNLYIADEFNSRIRVVMSSTASSDPTSGTFTVGVDGSGSLNGQGNVTLGNGSTLSVGNLASVSGSVLNLPANGGIALDVGANPSLAVTASSNGGVLDLASVGQGNSVVPMVAAGNVRFSVGSVDLVFAVKGSAVVTPFTSGNDGFAASVSSDAVGNTTVTVQSGSATLAYPASNGNTASLTVYSGDQLVFNSAGYISNSGVGESSIGQPFSPSAPLAGFTANPAPATITGSSPHLSNGTLDSALTAAVNSVTGMKLQDSGVDGQGDLHLEGSAGGVVAAPVFVSLNPVAPAEQSLANGDIGVAVANGLVVELAPAISNLPGLLSALDQTLGSGNAITRETNGTMLISSHGVTYAVRAGWSAVADLASAGLHFQSNASLVFTDQNGISQNLYPSFVNPSALQNALTMLDAKSGMQVEPNGTAAVVLRGVNYVFTPLWIVESTPIADANLPYWVRNGVVYLNNGDGTCQGFTLN